MDSTPSDTPPGVSPEPAPPAGERSNSERPASDSRAVADSPWRPEVTILSLFRPVLFEPGTRWGTALLVALAVLAMTAQLAARGVAPALPGVWMGAEHAITAVKLVAAFSSQLCAVAATLLVLGLTLAVVRSAAPAALRAFSVGVGVLTVLAVDIATMVKLPEISRLVLAVASSGLAIACARIASRYFTSRAPALVCGAVAVSGLARVVAIVVAGRATADKDTTLALVARIFATLSQTVVLVAVVVALLWLVMTPRLGRSRGLAPFVALATVVALAAAGAITAHVGGDPEAEGVVLLVTRIFEQLVPRPLPHGPAPFYAALEALRWLAAASLLVVAPRSRAMAAAVTLALAAGATVEIPLCAAALVIGSLALVGQPGPDLRHDVPR